MMADDNWRHRGSRMICLTCIYYMPKELPKMTPVKLDPMAEQAEQQVSHVGRCRRHAPTMSGWPVMFQTDWCGDHKLDENKA